MLQNTPKYIKMLLIINGIIFFLVNILGLVFGGHAGLQKIFISLGLVPALFWKGAVWQPVSSMFLHGGLLHILMNMIALWSIGSLLEHNLGSKRFIKLYLVSGLAGALFVVVFQAGSVIPTIGASGAITGLLGALAVLYPRTSLLFFFIPVKARTAAIILGAVSVILALTDPGSQISHLGHLGGLIGGLLFIKLGQRSIQNRQARFEEKNTYHEWDRSGTGNSLFTESVPGRTVKKRVVIFDPYTGKFYYKE